MQIPLTQPNMSGARAKSRTYWVVVSVLVVVSPVPGV